MGKIYPKAIVIGIVSDFVSTIVLTLVLTGILNILPFRLDATTGGYLLIILMVLCSIFGGYMAGRVAQSSEITNGFFTGLFGWILGIILTFAFTGQAFKFSMNLEIFGFVQMLAGATFGGFLARKTKNSGISSAADMDVQSPPETAPVTQQANPDKMDTVRTESAVYFLGMKETGNKHALLARLAKMEDIQTEEKAREILSSQSRIKIAAREGLEDAQEIKDVLESMGAIISIKSSEVTESRQPPNYCPKCKQELAQGVTSCPNCETTAPRPAAGVEKQASQDEKPRTSRLAIASFALLVFAMLDFPFFVGIQSILGVVLGISALISIRKSRGRIKGTGLAVGGIVVGCFCMIVIINNSMLNDRRYQARKKQMEAKTNLVAIANAELAYFDKNKKWAKTFGDINWEAGNESRYSYYLSCEEVIPSSLTGYDECPNELSNLFAGYETDQESGFYAAAVGNVDEDSALDIWIIGRDRILKVINDDKWSE